MRTPPAAAKFVAATNQNAIPCLPATSKPSPLSTTMATKTQVVVTTPPKSFTPIAPKSAPAVNINTPKVPTPATAARLVSLPSSVSVIHTQTPPATTTSTASSSNGMLFIFSCLFTLCFQLFIYILFLSVCLHLPF